MDVKNWILKRKQIKSLEINDEFGFFQSLAFHCPKYHWGTDELKPYIVHLENHLIKKPKYNRKRGQKWK